MVTSDRERSQVVSNGHKQQQMVAKRHKRSKILPNGQKQSQSIADDSKPQNSGISNSQTVTYAPKPSQVVANGKNVTNSNEWSQKVTHGQKHHH